MQSVKPFDSCALTHMHGFKRQNPLWSFRSQKRWPTEYETQQSQTLYRRRKTAADFLNIIYVLKFDSMKCVKMLTDINSFNCSTFDEISVNQSMKRFTTIAILFE